MKGSLVIHLFGVLTLAVLLAPLGALSISCSAYMRCSNAPDPVYGLAGDVCDVYVNACQLSLQNCDRKENNETLIIPSNAKECKPFCPSVCPMYILPICGEFANQKRSFNNPCVMKTYNCKNGKVFTEISKGKCQ